MVIVVAVLTGCTPPPAIIEKPEAPQTIAASPQALHPLNCGTPDEFKICPMATHYHDAILVEPLPDSDPPDSLELETTPPPPEVPLPAPMPPVPPPPEAQ